MKKTVTILLVTILGTMQAYSQSELYGTSLRIGKIGDIGNKNVPVGGITQQYNIDFTGYRDVRPDQIGARISALRFNNHVENLSYIQITGLAFYTNPIGIESGTGDLQERMRILPNGYIGIGTTAPTSMLDVEGTIKTKDGLTIGKEGDPGNTNAAIDEITKQYNIDFTGYRDVVPNQVGARISALRFNKSGTNAYVQNTGLAFYTNPNGLESGVKDLTERMRISPNGYIGIGTAAPKEMLDVAGTIRAYEVKIEINKGADYVFEKDYHLRPLSQVKRFIKDNKHLPDIPSEKDMQENGLNINEFQINLLRKIEELTLYIIKQEDNISHLQQEIDKLKSGKD